jgi:hypothetical protein
VAPDKQIGPADFVEMKAKADMFSAERNTARFLLAALGPNYIRAHPFLTVPLGMRI